MRDGAPAAGTGHDLEAGIEVDHGRRELRQHADIALDLRRAVGDLRLQGLRAHHRQLEVGAVDGQGQVGVRRLKALDVGQRRVLHLDDEGLAVVRRDEVDGEAQALGLAAVHADAEEVQEQLGRHRPDHVGARRAVGGLALRDAGAQFVGAVQEAVAHARRSPAGSPAARRCRREGPWPRRSPARPAPACSRSPRPAGSRPHRGAPAHGR